VVVVEVSKDLVELFSLSRKGEISGRVPVMIARGHKQHLYGEIQADRTAGFLSGQKGLRTVQGLHFPVCGYIPGHEHVIGRGRANIAGQGSQERGAVWLGQSKPGGRQLARDVEIGYVKNLQRHSLPWEKSLRIIRKAPAICNERAERAPADTALPGPRVDGLTKHWF
jgi:hypothetical protein